MAKRIGNENTGDAISDGIQNIGFRDSSEGDSGIEPNPFDSSSNGEPTEPPKRKRGRPALNGDSGIGSGNNQEGGRTKAKKGRLGLDSAQLARQIYGVHKFLAISVPELAISENESLMLAESFNELSRQYDFGLSPKVQAWISLAGTCALVYGPRIPAMATRMKTTKSKPDLHVVGIAS